MKFVNAAKYFRKFHMEYFDNKTYKYERAKREGNRKKRQGNGRRPKSEI
jgi:hypothetical protein